MADRYITLPILFGFLRIVADATLANVYVRRI